MTNRTHDLPPRNLLAGETSPYLLQHKDNPVAWFPWGAAALAEAKASDRPILLSIGYAACHWCHVMAHESFEDPDIAALMNRLFVNIKIDREERPDLDQIHQQALALLGQQGGWPLTMFLTPEGKPFWGGTYFPKEARWGRPGFADVLNTISTIHRQDKGKVETNVAALDEAMRKLARPRRGGEISAELLDRIADRLLGEIDFAQGGIKGAPKFPQAPILNLLWRAFKRSGNTRCRDAVLISLKGMIQGGIYDHLGGGLARYSTDAFWLVPHFEKMLYDNAELLSLLAQAWQETRDPLFAMRAREIVSWLTREMLAEPDAKGARAFAAALDADSEGHEGKFYVWAEEEIDEVLGADASFFKRHYGISAAGNWEGTNILNRSQAPDLLDEAGEARLSASREKLLARRTRRIRPAWDDKVLGDWNGLMIGALADAAQVFDEPAWLKLAADAFSFIARNMIRQGRLTHAWRLGRANHPANLDDHAHLALAALRLFEATGDADYLVRARDLVRLLDEHYWDRNEGGYFFTADDTKDVVLRAKSAADNATPNGNGAMLEVLWRLHLLTGDADYAERAGAQLAAFSGEAGHNFFPLATFLNGADFLLNAVEIVIVGDPAAPDARALRAAIFERALPNRVLSLVPPDPDKAGAILPPLHPAAGKGRIDGKATAYVCRRQTCSAPLTDPAGLSAALRLG